MEVAPCDSDDAALGPSSQSKKQPTLKKQLLCAGLDA